MLNDLNSKLSEKKKYIHLSPISWKLEETLEILVQIFWWKGAKLLVPDIGTEKGRIY